MRPVKVAPGTNGHIDLRGTLCGPYRGRGQHLFRVIEFHNHQCRPRRPMPWRTGHWRTKCEKCGQEYCEGQLMHFCPG